MGHPRGLYVLFFTEMWERFSYYGMRSLLVLYMVQSMHEDVATASAWYGLYTGMIYLTPVAGGIIADRYWGQHRSVLLGGALMAAGHFAMLLPQKGAFYAALALIVVGCGLFKPSISVQVGMLYPIEDARRDSAFSLFYMGINLGAFLAPLVCGTLGQNYGWHYGFGCAGLGMLVALLIYRVGQRHLPTKQLSYAARMMPQQSLPPGAHMRRLLALGVLAVFGNIAFWATFEQAGTSLTLFAEQSVDLHMGPNTAVPSSWFQMANPLFIMALGPLFSLIWLRLRARRCEPSTPLKFVFGLGFVGCGFALMSVAGARADAGILVSPLWLIACYFCNSCGELCISPVGLSAVTKLAPARWMSLAMGLWFASQALANALGGALAGEYAAMSHHDFFAAPALLAVLSAGMMCACVRPLQRAM